MPTWKSVPGFEGIYEVSDDGVVRSLDRVQFDALGRKKTFKGKIKNKYYDNNGYPKVTLAKHGIKTRVHVHVIVASDFLGPRPEGMHICHNNGDEGDPRASNLRYDTPKQNMADKVIHGTQPIGLEVPSAKLTDDEIRQIRDLRGHFTCRQIAEIYSTSPSHVCNVQKGNRRYHVE